MGKELGIYISAAPDREAECERLGQLLAHLTPGVRWVIKRTPLSGEGGNPDLAALRAGRFYLMVLGMDILAPMGVEWLAAQKAGLTMLAFRSSTAVPSPAASDFARHAGSRWISYDTPLAFQRLAERALVEALVEGTPGYGLDLADIEHLAARLEALNGDPSGPPGEERRGAGRGGVILPRA
jgi:hypothetical protein